MNSVVRNRCWNWNFTGHRNCPLAGAEKGRLSLGPCTFPLFLLILVGEDTLNTFLVLLATQQIGVLAQRLKVLGPQESLVFLRHGMFHGGMFLWSYWAQLMMTLNQMFPNPRSQLAGSALWKGQHSPRVCGKPSPTTSVQLLCASRNELWQNSPQEAEEAWGCGRGFWTHSS